MPCIVRYGTGMYSQLSKISSEIYFFFKFWISIIRTLYIYMSDNVRIRGYFSKPKGVLEQKHLEILMYTMILLENRPANELLYRFRLE